MGAALRGGSFPLLLGGEHTVSVGAFAALAESGRDVGVVQVDAHADLREEYEGSRWSHACVMRRAVELSLPVFQVGVRAMCREEHEFRRQARIPHLDGKTALKRGVHGPMLPKDFPREVWLTFDVDGLDPSLMPATGTPVPGGLDWRLAMAVLDRIGLEDRRLLGADVVELAPITGLHHPDFTAARLCYEIMGRVG
ncbi:arginase family protein [Desulfohalovibrio reitneri]|uniref:arginase family protein n=1 Tax=Desulfohalovibrio reitneri TaxID=1307759 RepID=UPI00313461F4